MRNVPKSPTSLAILLCYDSYFGPHVKEDINKFLIPIIEHIGRNPKMKLNMKIPGVTLSAMLWYNYKFVEKLVSMETEGKLEFLGTAFSNPVLPLLDKQIVSEQVVKQREYIKLIFDTFPRGFSFPYDSFSKEILPLLHEHDYKYFICEDAYFDAAAVKSLSDCINKRVKISDAAISKLIFAPRKLIYESSDFTVFTEFTEFSTMLKKTIRDGSEKAFYKFLEESLDIFHLFDRSSLITLKIHVFSIFEICHNEHIDSAKAVKVLINFLDFISECEHISINLYEKWYSERSQMLYENKNQIICSSDFRRYSTYEYPDLLEKFSSIPGSNEKMEALKNFMTKVQSFQRVFSTLLRTEREKIAYNPMIELSKVIGLFYQYSFGAPDEAGKLRQCHNNFNRPGAHLGYINEMRLKTKGVYVSDINGDKKDEIIFVNDRIFVLMNERGEMESFINLATGAEAISSIPACADYSRKASIPDQLCCADYYRVAGQEGPAARIKYDYRPSQSILVGAQFLMSDHKLKIVKSASLYNNTFVLRYNIKNTGIYDISFDLISKFAFAPDYLSVIKYGKPVLGFFTDDRALEAEKSYEIGSSGIGVVNRLNNSYIYMTGARVFPQTANTSVLFHSFGIELTYPLQMRPDEECNFILNIVFNAH